MNITSQINTPPLATVVNPPTDSLRRDNLQREVITQPAAVSRPAAEKGTASDKDKAKTPAQNNEHIDFANIKKQAEIANSTISDQTDQQPQEKDNSPEQPVAEQGEQTEKKSAQDDNTTSPQEEFAEQQEINQLSQRDREVRSHELAHAAVGGAHTGTPNYEFTVGPDGKKYATGGEVSVDLSPVSGNPQATITKLQKVHSAALAPANPSVQDTKVAAQAARLILQAQSELLAQKLDNTEFAEKPAPATSPTLDRFAIEQSDNSNENKNSSNNFDQFITETLNAQEKISPSRSEDVSARAGRIENFYQSISQAYDKPPSSHFKLSA